MAFELLEFTEAHVATFTKRIEKHGDEDKQAVSLGLEITTENFVLDLIDPTLRQALYKPKDDNQANIPDVRESTPVLRTNSAERVLLGNKHEGWTLEIDATGNENEPMKFGGVKLSKFSVEPKQGGSVVLRMQVGTSDIDTERFGWLGMHHGESIWLRLISPKNKPAAIDGSTEAFENDHPDAGTLFAEGADGNVDDSDDKNLNAAPDADDSGPALAEDVPPPKAARGRRGAAAVGAVE